MRPTGIGIWLLLIFTASSVFGRQNEEDLYELRNLAESWTVYDEDRSAFVPYFPAIHPEASVLHLNFPSSDLRNRAKIALNLPAGSYLFVNNRLMETAENDRQVLLDSADFFRTDSTANFLLSLQNKAGFGQIPGIRLLLDIPFEERKTAAESKKYFPGLPEASGRTVNKTKANFLIFLGLAVMLIVSATGGSKIGMVTSLFSGGRDNFGSRRSENKSIVLADLAVLSVFFALSNGLALFFLLQSEGEGLAGSETYSTLFFDFAGIFMFFLLLLPAKMFGVRLLTGMFNDKRFYDAHLRLIDTSESVLAILLSVAFGLAAISYPLADAVGVMLPVYLLLRLIEILAVGFRLKSVASYRNMFLIFYLCATELIPLVVSIQFFMISRSV